MLKSIPNILFLCLVVMSIASCKPQNTHLEQLDSMGLGIILNSEIKAFENIEGYQYFYLEKLNGSNLQEKRQLRNEDSNLVEMVASKDNKSHLSKQNDYLIKFNKIEPSFEQASSYKRLLNEIMRIEALDRQSSLTLMADQHLCASVGDLQQVVFQTRLEKSITKQLRLTGRRLLLNQTVCASASVSTRFFFPELADFYLKDKTVPSHNNQPIVPRLALREFVKILELEADVSLGEQDITNSEYNQDEKEALKDFTPSQMTLNLEHFCVYTTKNGKNDAKIERKRQKLQQLVIFQMTFNQFGLLFDFSNVSQTCIQHNESWLNSFLQSMQDLRKNLNQMGLFTKDVQIDIYDFDEQSKQFAYMLRGKGNQRAYINFNFSFDIQPMLLPLGFMNSSKINLWQSDAPNLVTFVSNKNIVSRPLTASVIMMN